MPALPVRVQTPEPTKERPRIDTIRMIHPSVAEMRSLVGERTVGRFPDREWIVLLPPGSTAEQVAIALKCGRFKLSDAGNNVFVSPKLVLYPTADEMRSLVGARLVNRFPNRQWIILLPDGTEEQARMALRRSRFELRDDGVRVVVSPKLLAFDLLGPDSESILK